MSSGNTHFKEGEKEKEGGDEAGQKGETFNTSKSLGKEEGEGLNVDWGMERKSTCMKESSCFDDAVKEACEAKCNNHKFSSSSNSISEPTFSS